MSTSSATVPGLDIHRLRAWLSEACPGRFDGDLRADLITGGRSNLTYRLQVGDTTCILRRPPLGHVLATAHDMSREYTVMRALDRSEVPVPHVLASCEDVDVIGAPFYVMDFVEGSTYRSRHNLAGLGPDRVRSLSEDFVDVLARIHSVDHREVGLQDFGRPEGYLARQVSRWRTQLEASRTRDLPDANRLVALLAERVPSSGPVGIVHGDYRLDNVIVDQHDRPAAVIDWEMSTIGDVLSDLGLTVVYMRLAAMVGDSRAEAVADASSAEGFVAEGEVLERYARTTGRDLGDFGFYLGLASFKLAGILEGIHFRYLQGQTLGPGFETIGDTVAPLLAAGLDSMKENY